MIALLLRLYPARWRARYGDEFEWVLAERPLGPFDIADILLGALDAHLHLRGLGAASEHRRGFTMTLRIGGYAAVIGGVLWFVVLTWNVINDGAGTFAPWISLLLLSAIVITLVALVGLSAFQARRNPVLIWSAFAIPALGAVVSLLGYLAVAASGDSDRELIAGISPWMLGSLGLLTMLFGSTLFAIGAWVTRDLSRTASGLLAIGAPLVILAIAGASGGLPSPIAFVLVAVAIVAFPVGWIAMGISAIRIDRQAIGRLDGASV